MNWSAILWFMIDNGIINLFSMRKKITLKLIFSLVLKFLFVLFVCCCNLIDNQLALFELLYQQRPFENGKCSNAIRDSCIQNISKCILINEIIVIKSSRLTEILSKSYCKLITAFRPNGKIVDSLFCCFRFSGTHFNR